MKIPALPFLALAAATSCGGNQTQTHTADAPEAEADPSTEFDTSVEDSDDASDAEPEQSRCSGDLCTVCGSAVCPKGFLCEEESSSCSWLPECADDYSCGCVENHMAGCTCEERDDGVFITCSR